MKALGLPVSEKNNFEDVLLYSYAQTCGASFDPKDIIWTNLVEVNKEMLYIKYQL